MLVSANLLRAGELPPRYPPADYSANAFLYERRQIDDARDELRR